MSDFDEEINEKLDAIAKAAHEKDFFTHMMEWKEKMEELYPEPKDTIKIPLSPKQVFNLSEFEHEVRSKMKHIGLTEEDLLSILTPEVLDEYIDTLVREKLEEITNGTTTDRRERTERLARYAREIKKPSGEAGEDGCISIATLEDLARWSS